MTRGRIFPRLQSSQPSPERHVQVQVFQDLGSLQQEQHQEAEQIREHESLMSMNCQGRRHQRVELPTLPTQMGGKLQTGSASVNTFLLESKRDSAPQVICALEH